MPAIIEVEQRSPEEMRAGILKLEAAMKAMLDSQVDLKVEHHFAPGIYMRALLIPKGTCLTGKIHKTEHLNILSQGEMTVWTEGGMKRIQASTVVKSLPGIKRAGFAHEDSVWITVHANPTEEPDAEKLEEMLVVDTFEEFLFHMESKQLTEGAGICHSSP